MTFIKYNNPNLLNFNNANNTNNINNLNFVSKSAEANADEARCTFDIESVKERLKQGDKSALEKLTANSIEYEYNETGNGFELKYTISGTKYTYCYNSSRETQVGKGSWNTQTIEDAGIDLDKYGKYFIQVYYNYFRFNTDIIKQDFQGKNIQTPTDLKAAIDELESKEETTIVGVGSWSTEQIELSGIDLNKYGKYFIGVYTNIYRFNEEAIKQDFQGKNIQTPADLKAAIDGLQNSADNAAVSTRTQNFSDGSYSIYEIDVNGRDLKRTDYNADGSLQGILEFTYNDNGTVIQTSKNAAGTVTQITNIDANGNVTHNSWFNEDGSLREIADYQRDENGVETTITRGADGTIRNKDVYDWTNNKRILSETYDKNGNLYAYDKYEYDVYGALTTTTYNSDNKMIVKSIHDPDGSLSSVSEYNDNEQITTNRQFKNGKVSIYAETSYKENGRVNGHVMTWYNDDGTVSSKRIYEFGSNGQILNGNLVGVTASHQYWYDSDGNITKEEHDEVKTDLQNFEERVNSDEFDKDFDVEEVWNYIDEYVKLLSEDLKSKDIYSEEFIEKLVDFIQDSINSDVYHSILDKYGDPGYGGINVKHFEGSINLKNILNNLINTCKELTEQSSTDCNSETFHYSNNDTTGQFLWSLIQNIYNNNRENINIPDVLKFTDILTQYIAQEFGMIDDLQRYGSINFANLVNYDTNGDGNWLNEFYDIVTKFVHLNDNMDLNSVTTVSVETLFNDKDELLIPELIEKLENTYLLGDAGLNKFGVMINNILNKFNINDDYDTEDLIKSIVILMNKAAGVENSYPVIISRDTIEQLNEKGMFDELDKIINSDELRDLYYFGVDGYIDDFGQGATGDCWLLAGVISLNSTDTGRQIIHNSITTDKNGNITVSFKGIGLSYTITSEEMVEAKNAYAYSHGDNDVQALELATEKLFRQIANNEIELPYGNYISGQKEDDNNGGLIWGNQTNHLMYYLTGNIPISSTWVYDSNEILEFLQNSYHDFQENNVCCYFYLNGGTYEATTTNNESCFRVSIPSCHAFAITNMTNNTVTIVNPWYSDKEYELFWDEFIKLNPNFVGSTSTKLHEHEYKSSWNNTVDFDSTFTINGKGYSLNDILSSDEPIFYETNDINNYKNCRNIKNILLNIAISALSDIKPEIVDNLVESLAPYYYKLLDTLDDDKTLHVCFMDGTVPVNSSIANENGVYQTETGGVVDIRNIVQKMLETLELATRDPMTLEEYENKLQGDEFDKEVSKEELNSYLNEYRELLINDMKSNYDYDGEYIRLLDDFIRGKISNVGYNSNIDEKFNLKEMLNFIKDIFSELQNSISKECQSADLGYYFASNLNEFSENIVYDAYSKNKDYIDALDVYQFQEQLIKYIAEKNGKAEELEKNGSIDLSELIHDSNGDGNWLDDFFSFVNEFSHKDDKKVYGNTLDYDAEFEYNGKKYTFHEILSSNEQVILNIDNEQYTYGYIYQLLQRLVNAMSDVQPKLRSSIIQIVNEYYYTFASLCFYEDAYNNGTDVPIYNALIENVEYVHFDSTVAENYGIIKAGEGVQIDIRILIQKLLEYV